MELLIHKNLIVQIATSKFEVHKDLAWVTKPDGYQVEVGQFYDFNTDQLTSYKHGDLAYCKQPNEEGIYESYVIQEYADIPDTHTLLKKPDELHSWSESENEWVVDPIKIDIQLSEKKSEWKEYMRNQAKSAIEASFTSNALGSTHTYDSRVEDQNNILMALSEAELSSPQEAMVCSNDGVEFAYRVHTLSQIKAVVAACGAHVKPIREKLIRKKAEIDAANTVEEVEVVTW